MPRSRPKHKKLKKRCFWAGAGLLTLVVASWLPVLALRWIDPPTTSFMLQDNSGRQPVSYQWTDWPLIDSSAPLAVVAAEDQKFPTHFGFDLDSIRDSLSQRSNGRGLRGASTITQQVAKNLFLWPGRNFIRKGIEAYFTLLIEIAWPKKRILEIYLNIAQFGPGIYGVGAASAEYFGKAPAQLTNAEAALLASVLPNPAGLHVDRPSSYVRERQAWILRQMARLRRDEALTL